MTARYGIFYAPANDTPLAEFGRSWLGRDAETDKDVAQPSISDISPEQVREFTEDPRHYGFHGTLKPPFELKPGASLEGLRAALRIFAKGQSSFEIPPLELATIGKFIALTPTESTNDLVNFARESVRAFEAFRAPLDQERDKTYREPVDEEDQVQRLTRLTVNQERMLDHWGYPYVMDEFRFHLSLTNRIADKDVRRSLYDGLEGLTSELCKEGVAFKSICLFGQSDPKTPMTLVERFPLSA